MKIIKVKNYDEMSQKAFEIMKEMIVSKPDANLGLATGGTPVGMYELLVKDHQEHGTDYQAIKTFNLDEYLGLEKEHAQTYYTFMHENLFNHINIKEENVHIPSGSTDDHEAEAKAYDQLLEENPIDLQLLGIGTNGHIGFNEPGSKFDGQTAVVDLVQSTIDSNARYFDGDKSLVPTQAISMGIGSIMKADRILLLASGADKAEAIAGTVEGPITEDLPASALQNHPNVTIVVDEDAASLLKNH